MFLMESAQAIGSSPFFAWMLELLRAIAAIRTPVLTAIMSGVTYLGHEMVFLVLAMILAWCVDKKYGYRYLAIFMVGSFLQQALKAACMIPRPWILDPTFRELVVESAMDGTSLPVSLINEPPKKLPKPMPKVVSARPATFWFARNVMVSTL